MDKICTYLFFLHDRRSPPHTPHLRSSYDSMRVASSQIPENSRIKILQFSNYLPLVSGSATNLVFVFLMYGKDRGTEEQRDSCL